METGENREGVGFVEMEQHFNNIPDSVLELKAWLSISNMYSDDLRSFV